MLGGPLVSAAPGFACGDGGGAPIVDAVAIPSASGSVSLCGVSFGFVDPKVPPRADKQDR